MINILLIIDIKIILRYSAMKISINVTLPYSVLNPDTNSLSPSAKSNGARFVSANVVTSHISNKGGAIQRIDTPLLKRVD